MSQPPPCHPQGDKKLIQAGAKVTRLSQNLQEVEK